MSLIDLLTFTIRFISLIWALVVWIRIRDWRIGFAAAAISVSTIRYGYSLSQNIESWEVFFGWESRELYKLLLGLIQLAAVVLIERALDERVERARELLLSRARLRLVNGIATAITSGMSVEDVIRRAVEQISGQFPAYRTAYSTISENMQLKVLYSVEPPGMPPLSGATTDLSCAPAYVDVLCSGQRFVAGAVRGKAALGPIGEKLIAGGTEAVLDVPLLHSNKLVGLLCFHSPGIHNWSRHEIQTLQEIADYLQIALRDAAAQKERKRLEGELRQSQKLEAVGLLAGGIAHDFNNLLTPIVGYAALLEEEYPEQSEQREKARQILQAANRGSDLVRQILTFSRKAEPEAGSVEMAPIVAEALKLLRSSIPKDIEMRERIAPGTGKVLANAAQIHRVVVNLCTNACQAMAMAGGSLDVGLEVVGSNRLAAPADAPLRNGAYVRLTVSDTGPGVDPAIKERLFEPFFTTKESSRGTGLGLSVVHGIVAGLGGVVSFDNRAGGGTIFQVCLPRIQEPARPATTARRADLFGSERILVVDDEEPILQVTQQSLRRFGYQVTTSSSGEEALNVFRDDPQAFDVILTDVNMPGMNGLELTRSLTEIRQGVPIVFMTGFNHSITPQQTKRLGVRELLMKPFKGSVLAAAVRRAVGSLGAAAHS